MPRGKTREYLAWKRERQLVCPKGPFSGFFWSSYVFVHVGEEGRGRKQRHIPSKISKKQQCIHCGMRKEQFNAFPTMTDYSGGSTEEFVLLSLHYSGESHASSTHSLPPAIKRPRKRCQRSLTTFNDPRRDLRAFFSQITCFWGSKMNVVSSCSGRREIEKSFFFFSSFEIVSTLRYHFSDLEPFQLWPWGEALKRVIPPLGGQNSFSPLSPRETLYGELFH